MFIYFYVLYVVNFIISIYSRVSFFSDAQFFTIGSQYGHASPQNFILSDTTKWQSLLPLVVDDMLVKAREKCVEWRGNESTITTTYSDHSIAYANDTRLLSKFTEIREF